MDRPRVVVDPPWWTYTTLDISSGDRAAQSATLNDRSDVRAANGTQILIVEKFLREAVYMGNIQHGEEKHNREIPDFEGEKT